jgi:hypothetical protein
MERQGGTVRKREYDNGKVKTATKIKIIEREQIIVMACPRCHRSVDEHHHYCYHCGIQFKSDK